MRLSAADIFVRYRGVTAVAGVSLTVEPGEVLALIGQNGSGKSSLIRAIAGISPHEGRVSIGEEQRSEDKRRLASAELIGYMPQDCSSNAALSVIETVLLGRVKSLALRVAEEDIETAVTTLSTLDLLPLADRYLGELSGGQRQLVFLAQALARRPSILLLDEPVAALDINHQVQVLAMVRALTRERGLATVMAIHDLNAAARHADTVGVLKRGELVALGPPRQVLRADLLARVFEVECAIDCGSDGYPVVIPLRHRPD